MLLTITVAVFTPGMVRALILIVLLSVQPLSKPSQVTLYRKFDFIPVALILTSYDDVLVAVAPCGL